MLGFCGGTDSCTAALQSRFGVRSGHDHCFHVLADAGLAGDSPQFGEERMDFGQRPQDLVVRARNASPPIAPVVTSEAAISQ